jgi:hypothetical protein
VFKPVVGKQLLDNPITLKFRDDPVETLKFNDDLKSPGLGKPPGLEGKQPGSLLALHFVLFAVAGRASHRARSPSHYHPHRWATIAMRIAIGGTRPAHEIIPPVVFGRGKGDRPECRCG